MMEHFVALFIELRLNDYARVQLLIVFVEEPFDFGRMRSFSSFLLKIVNVDYPAGTPKNPCHDFLGSQFRSAFFVPGSHGETVSTAAWSQFFVRR